MKAAAVLVFLDRGAAFSYATFGCAYVRVRQVAKLPSFGVLAISAFFVLLSGPLAQAATWTVNQQNPDSLYEDAGGNNGGADNVNVFLSGDGDLDLGAGMFRQTADDGEMVQTFVAFCVELTQFITLPDEYSDTLIFSTSVLNKINSLVSNAFALIKDSATAAAFQVALWEIIAALAGLAGLRRPA